MLTEFQCKSEESCNPARKRTPRKRTPTAELIARTSSERHMLGLANGGLAHKVPIRPKKGPFGAVSAVPPWL